MLPSVRSIGSLFRSLRRVFACLALVLPAVAWSGPRALIPLDGCLVVTTTTGQTALMEGSEIDLTATALLPSTPSAPTESVQWIASDPDVVFRGGDMQTGTWAYDGANDWYAMTVQKTIFVPDGSGPSTLSLFAQNLTSCITTTPPFNLNVLPLNGTGDAALSHSGSLAQGATFTLQLQATHEAPPGNVLAAVGVPFQLTIDQLATFVATGTNTMPVVTGPGGTASMAVTIDAMAPVGQTFQIIATAAGYPSPVANLVVQAAGSHTIFVTDGDGQSIDPDTTSAPIIFEVKDPSGVPLMGFTAQAQVIGSGDATFSSTGTTSTSINAGTSDITAQFTLDAGPTPGPVLVRIYYPSITSPLATTDVNVNIANPVSTSIDVISGDGQSIDAGATSGPIVVQPVNQNGPVFSYHLFMTVVEGDATFEGSGSSTFESFDNDEDSYHEFRLVAGDTPGPVLVKIDGDGLTPGYVSAEIVPTIPLIDMEVLGGDGQSGVVGSVLPDLLGVRLPPAAAATATSGAKALPNVRFVVSTGQARFTQNNSTQLELTPDPVTGEAWAQLRLGNEIGRLTVTASAPGYTSRTFNLTALAPGTDVVLTPVSSPENGQPNSESAPLIVELTRGGTPVASGAIHWEIVNGDASLTAVDTSTDASGRAQTSLQFGNSTGVVLVRASHTALLPDGTSFVVSTDFSITVGSGGSGIRVEVLSGNGQTGSVGSLLDHPIVFRASYPDGAPAVATALVFTASGPGTLIDVTGVTNADGDAFVHIRFADTPGVVTVNASVGFGATAATAIASSFTPALVIESGNQQTGAPGAELPLPLVVRLSQAASAMAKGLAGVTVNWQVVCGNGSVQSPATTTNAEGESTNLLTLGSTPGCNEVTASVAGVGSVTFAATGGVPPGTVLEIVAGNGQSLVPLENSAPLQVRVRSASGAAIAGAVVTFAADRSGVTLTPTETSTSGDGLASTIARIDLPVGIVVLARLRDAPDAPTVQFTLNAGVAYTSGLSPGEIGVARAIDQACPRLAGMSNLSPEQQDLLARCSELVVNAEDDAPGVGRALGEMLADEASSQNNATLMAANNQLDNLKARFAALRAGARGVDLTGLNVMVPGGALSLGLLPSAIVMAAGEPPEEIGNEFSRWGFFATGTIGRGERDPDTYDLGYEYDSYDITAGVDYRLTDSWILGAALGFNSNNTDLPDGRGGMDAKGWTVSGYASYFNASAWYADAVLGMGRNNFDLERSINYSIDGLAGGRTLVDQIASASPDADRTSLSLSVGRDFNRGAWTFGPYLRATYSRIDFDAYTETMSSPGAAGSGLAMAVDGRELKSLQGVVGGKISHAISTSWGILLPNAQIEWVNEFEDDPELLVTRFAFDPTQTPILVESDRIDNSYFNLGVGLSGVFASGRSAYVYYERVAGQDRVSSDSLAIGVRIEF